MRKSLLLCLVALLALTAVAGCAPKPTPQPPDPTTAALPQTEPAPATEAPQELTIGVGRNLYSGPKSWYVVHGSLDVWEPLVILDQDMVAQPVLATSWEMEPSGHVWTFHLRQGVRFHDGTPFNADAVLLNVPKLQESYERTLPNLSRLEKVDDYTVRFVLSEPTPNLPQHIAYFSSAMMSPASLGEDGLPAEPVGTGPFKFVDHVKDDRIIVARNDDYWGQTPHLSRVTFRYIPDATTRLAALQSGQIDAIADVGSLQPEQAPVVESDPNLVLLQQPVATTHYLTFNSGRPPFEDARLRRAASMAIDRQALVDQTLHGFGQPGSSVITPLCKEWARTDISPRYAPEEATALAQEALGGERTTARLLLNSGLVGRWPYENMAQIIQAALAPLGIDIQIQTLEGGAWNEALQAGDYELTLMPYTLMAGDPDFFMQPWVASDGDLNRRRSYGYANQRADELIAAARCELDPATRKAQYDELQAIVAEDVPFTPLYHEVTLYAMHKSVRGLQLDIQFKPSLGTTQRVQ